LNKLYAMRFSKIIFAFLLVSSLSEVLHADLAANGELLLGFRALGGKGASYDSVFDLGSAASLSPTGISYDFSGINSGLSITYGNNWWTRTDLYYGVIGTDQNNLDFWLGRPASSPLGTALNPSSLGGGDLGSIVSGVGNVQLVATTTASPPGSLFTNSGQVLSVFPNNISGSLTLNQQLPAWSYFPSVTDYSVTNRSTTIAKYSMDQNTLAGNPAVDVGSLLMSNGVLTLKSFSSGGGGPGAYAGPWNWTNGSGNWSVTNNWTSNQVASNGYAVGITGTTGGTITNNAVSNLASMTFSNGAGSYSLTGGNLSISGGITNNSTSIQRIDLSIVGAGGVTQSGSGTTVLTRSNSYVGGTTLSRGAVVIGDNNALGGGAVTVSGASSLIVGTANLSTTNSMAFNASTTVDSGVNRWTNSGRLSGSGTLTKIGSGSLTIAGNGSTYSGNTALTAGALQVAAGASLGSGTVTVASGAKLSGSGSLGGILVQSRGTLSGGVDGGVGKLTLSSGLTFSAGSILNWKLSDANGNAGTGFDSFAIGGALNLSGLGTGSTLQFNILNGMNGTMNFQKTDNSQWLVASARSISGFSTNDFTISTDGFANDLGGGSFSFVTNNYSNNLLGLYLKFNANGVDPWTGNLTTGSNVISGQIITSTNSAVIGANSSRNGSVAVTNNGTWNVRGTVLVGGSTNGSGTLSIGSGGNLTAQGLRISDLAGSKGLVVISNGASQNAISLGSGTVSFGAGNGTLQFAQSNSVTLSNSIVGKGTISSTGTGVTTLSGNQSGFTGTNYLSSGVIVLAAGVTNAGTVNVAGKNASFNLNNNAVLSSTGTHAVAGLLLDNSGLSFTNAIRGQVVLASTGVLQKTYAANQSVAGFGAGIGAGKTFSILAGTAAANGANASTLQAKLVNGSLDFKGTFGNAAVMSITDPSFSSIKNTIQWYNTNSGTWQNTTAGNIARTNKTNAISGMNGKSFAGSFSSFLLTANVPVGLGLIDANHNGSLLDDLNALSGTLINSTLAKIMGAYGYDASSHTSWAVINHNSIFDSGDGSVTTDLASAALADDAVTADLSVFNTTPVGVQVVPEPGTWALMVMGVGALLLVAGRKKLGSV
jgi:fibronectin-binding autotransporter adhesin